MLKVYRRKNDAGFRLAQDALSKIEPFVPGNSPQSVEHWLAAMDAVTRLVEVCSKFEKEEPDEV